MGFLAFIKGMKIEDNHTDNVTFRTSKCGGVLGLGLMVAGIALGVQVLCGNTFFCFFRIFSGISGLSAFALFIAGLLISSYRRTVVVNFPQSRIEVTEMVLMQCRQSSFHFREIEHLELCSIGECLVSTPCQFWTLKAYIRHHDHVTSFRLFESPHQHQTEEAAKLLSRTLSKQVLHAASCPLPEDLPADTAVNF